MNDSAEQSRKILVNDLKAIARLIPTVEIDVARGKLMVTTSQSSGNIWVLDQANQ